ncbi:EIF2B3 [Acanthosepion pharaonis]|uniref:Translation initiation factor eIF2B subunit gamma n=1 Tax=Acanthosepion pharaonis TaxID=158019 RepID=A0A812CBF2_ACAPH|nr:EIF2B3 [Sepia pharaonis]
MFFTSREKFNRLAFQPVIMAAGTGSRMTDLTASIPKALLTVGNKPMIWYSIHMCQRVGFQDVIVIVLESKRTQIEKALKIPGDISIKIDFVGIPDDEYSGTADSLRRIKNKIKSDILVISSDLITDMKMEHMIESFMAYDADVGVLLSPLPKAFNETQAPGVKVKKQKEKDIVGLDKNERRLLFYSNEADFEDDITLKNSFLKKCPFVKLRNDLTDCHMYFLKKWIFDFLLDKKSMSTLKGDLIPYLINKQFVKPPQLEKKDNPYSTDSMEIGSYMSDVQKKDIFSYIPADIMAEAKKLSLSSSRPDNYLIHDEKILCLAYIQNSGFCVRTNTIANYAEANKQIYDHFEALAPDLKIQRVPKAYENLKTITKSLLGDNSSVGQNVIIAESVIGPQCQIKDDVKIKNSIILDHTIIHKGSKIENCIICDNAFICSMCDLKSTVVGSCRKIEESVKLKNETLVDAQEMMEI